MVPEAFHEYFVASTGAGLALSLARYRGQTARNRHGSISFSDQWQERYIQRKVTYSVLPVLTPTRTRPQ